MKQRRFVLLVSVLFVMSKAAGAHHSFAGVYDGAQLVTVSGVVTEFKFVNPHAMMSVNVTDPSGKVAKWTIEFDGRLALTEGGWTADTLKPKEHVTVTGNPVRADTGTQRLFFRRLTKSDGTELVRYQDQRFKNVEEERRQRASQRNLSK